MGCTTVAGSPREAEQEHKPRLSTLTSMLQGAELMSRYGVNVPPGVPVFKLEEVLPAAQKMADEQNQVGAVCSSSAQEGVHACRRLQACTTWHSHASLLCAHYHLRAHATMEGLIMEGRLMRAMHVLPCTGGGEEPDPGGRARPGHLQEWAAGRRAHLQRG